MARGPSFFYFFLLFFCYTAGVTSSDIPLSHGKHSEVIWEKKQLFPCLHRVLIEYLSYKITQHDSLDPPTTPLPSPPITNPPVNGIVTVPGTSPPVTNPINPPVNNPVSPSVTNPINPPVTNPVNSPVNNNPVIPPVTNPVNPPVNNNPVNPPINNNPVNPPVNNNPVSPPAPTSTTPTPTGSGGRWCIAKNGASQAVLQAALDYACGTGGADCATIQQGSTCYEPPTLENHASYAFNSYYQKNPAPTSCDFGGVATVTTTDPSTSSCVYQSSSSSSSSSSSVAAPLTTQAPVNPTPLPTAPPTTSSSSGPGTQYPPPPGFSIGSPDPTRAFGASPPLVNNPSASNNLRPIIGFLLPVAFIFM